MSAQILGCVSHNDQESFCHHSEAGTYAANHLGMWMLQRSAHQNGCWYVQLHIRGVCITGLAVQDDFGALQMVVA